MKALALAAFSFAAVALAQPAPVAPALQTQSLLGAPTPHDVAIWVHPTDVTRSLIFSTNDQGGLISYTLDGLQQANAALGLTAAVDVRYRVPVDGRPTDVLVSIDTSGNFRFLSPDSDAGLLTVIDEGSSSAGLTPSGGALFFNARKQALSFIVVSSGGDLRQFDVFDNDAGLLRASPSRSLTFPKAIEGIAVDDRTGQIYITLATLGLFRMPAEVDAGSVAIEIDNVDGGHLISPAGIALHFGPNGTGNVIVSSRTDPVFNVYSLTPPYLFAGSFTLVADGGIPAVASSSAIETVPLSLGGQFSSGLFVAADPLNVNNKLVRWGDIAASQSPSLIVSPTLDPRNNYGAGADSGTGPDAGGLPLCPIILDAGSSDGGLSGDGGFVDAGSSDAGVSDAGCTTTPPGNGGGGVIVPHPVGGGFPEEPKSGCGCGEAVMLFPLALLAWMLRPLRRRRSSQE